MNYPTEDTRPVDTDTVHVPGLGERRVSRATPASPENSKSLAEKFMKGGLDAVRNPDHK